MSNSNESDSDQDDSDHNFDPGDEFELNRFLLELAREITTQELKELKFLLKGSGGSGRNTLEGITDAMDYFDHLRQRHLLSMDNLCTLQAFIWHLGRKDLYEKIVRFGRESENKTLYFYAPRDTPENGYRYIKFHVEGKVSRAHVKKTKSEIARLLCVPIEFVSIAGIEKSKSIIITLMVPEECVKVLSTLTDKEKLILNQISIDHFTIDGNIYPVTDIDYIEGIDEEEMAIQKLMDSVNKMKKELDTCHVDLTKCKRKIKELSRFNENKVTETTTKFFYWQMANLAFKNHLLELTTKDKIPNQLQQQASLQYFNSLLERAEGLGYDRKLLDEMFEINGIIAKTRMTVAYQMIIQQQQLDIDIANITILHLKYTNQRLAFVVGKSLKEMEGNWNSIEFLQYVALQKALPIISNIQVGIPSISIDDETTKQILYETTKKLKQEEKTQLCNSIKMDKREEQSYRKDPNTLLEIISLRTKKPGVPFDLSEFVRIILQKVNRQDLLKKYEEILNRIVQEKQATKQPSASGTDRFTRTKKQPKEKSARESKTEQSPDINSRLQKMEEMMEKLVQMSASQHQSKMPYFDDIEDKKRAAQLFFSQRYMQGLE